MIRPLGKRVLLRPDTQDEKTASGIIIPEQATNPMYLTGRVVAVGSRVDLDVKAGDHLAFQKIYDEVKDGTETLYLIEDVFLIAVYE